MAIVGNNVDCASKNSQVKSEMLALRGVVDEINKCLSVLSDKLIGVILPELTLSGECDINKNEALLVPLAMEIKSIREEALKAIVAIQSMTNRCEL